MTLLGKVFTGLIFCLSLFFFAVALIANATHIDNKQLAADLEAKVREASTRNQELEELATTYKTEVQNEKASRSAALAALQRQLELANYNFLQQEVKARDLRVELTRIAQTNRDTQGELSDKSNENRALRVKLAESVANRDKLFQEMLSINDQLNQLQGVSQTLRDRAESLTD
ncbi:MAG: hypothetical protein AB8B50_07705 [Pirellulaceae bacterium]